MPVAVLEDANKAIATKIFYLDEDGRLTKRDYNMGSHFHASIRDVANITHLSALLIELEQEKSSFIIRGCLYSDVVDLSKSIRRRIHRNDEHPNEAPFYDCPQPWVMIDIDNLKLEPDLDFISNPEDAVQYAIHQLPVEFHDTSCYWQFSSSAGTGDTSLFKAHLWFWLTRPLTSYDLRQWATATNLNYGSKLIDPALFICRGPATFNG